MRKAFAFAFALAFTAAVFSSCKTTDCPAYGKHGEIMAPAVASDLA